MGQLEELKVLIQKGFLILSDVKNENDPRRGLGIQGLRLPTDQDMNRAMTGDIADNWLNLKADVETIFNTDYTPQVYVDMVYISGYMSDNDVHELADVLNKVGIDYSIRKRAYHAEAYSYLVTFNHVKNWVNVYDYKEIGIIGRTYESPIMAGGNTGTSYNVDQHFYLDIEQVQDKNDRAKTRTKVTVSFNPNRFVRDKLLREFEPILYFIQTEVISKLIEPWLHSADINCDILGDPNKLKLVSTNSDVAKNITVVNDTRYYEDTRIKFKKYNKTVERMANEKNHGYMHSAELRLAKELYGFEVARMELTVKESAITDIVKAQGSRAKAFRAFPTGLNIKYVYGGRKQHSFKALLNRAYQSDPGIYDLLLKQPLITREMLVNTRNRRLAPDSKLRLK